MMITKPRNIHIDIAALQHNVQCIRRLAPHSKLLAVVKANAYGHGLATIVKVLYPQCDGFGVCCLEEVIAIRHMGINLPIVLLQGFSSSDELLLLDQYEVECVVHHRYQLDILVQATTTPPLTRMAKSKYRDASFRFCPRSNTSSVGSVATMSPGK